MIHRNVVRRRFAALLAALLLLAFSAPLSAREVSFHVLMINDPHSNILPFREVAADGDTVTVGGLDRALWLVDRERGVIERESAAPVFLLEGGDMMLGVKGCALAGAPEYTSMAVMSCDAGVLGNHDFDGGAATLVKLGPNLAFPVLASNVKFNDLSVDVRFPKTVVIERGGVKIGCFGLVPPDLKSIIMDGSGFSVDKDIEAVARRCVAELEAKGVDAIVAINHIGLDRDKRLAAAVAGIDVIVGGHSHDAVRDKLVVRGPDGSGTIIGQTGCDGRFAGRFDVTLDDGHLVHDKSSWKLVDTEQGTPELESVRAIGLRAEEELATLFKAGNPAVVFASPVDVRNNVMRTKENALGDVMAEALRWCTRSRLGIVNGGSLRAGRVIPKGPFSAGDMLDLLPFGTKAARALVTGAEIRRQLEMSASSLRAPGEEYDPSKRLHSGEFLQIAGLRVKYNLAGRPALVSNRRMVSPGGRVADVVVDSSSGWVPLRDDEIYSIGSSEYAISSWDCLKVEILETTQLEALDRYFADVLHRRAKPETDGRICITGE